jgi:hypothetical protein
MDRNGADSFIIGYAECANQKAKIKFESKSLETDVNAKKCENCGLYAFPKSEKMVDGVKRYYCTYCTLDEKPKELPFSNTLSSWIGYKSPIYPRTLALYGWRRGDPSSKTSHKLDRLWIIWILRKWGLPNHVIFEHFFSSRGMLKYIYLSCMEERFSF